jgi:N-sulfoglucosamine sulfohydrolase
VPPYLADTPETRADLAAYYDEVTRMDREIGKILAELSAQGEAENTLVIFFSDNGMPFPRAKTSCYDSGIRTPLIMRWPGQVPQGAVSGSLFSTVDLTPSTLSLLGLEVPSSMQGRDLSRVLTDPRTEVRDYIHAERNWHDADDHQRAVRDRRYKYIKNFFPRRMMAMALDLMGSPSYESLLRLRDLNRLTSEQMRLFMVPRPGEELYDTWSDPYEFVNLAGDPKYSAVLERLRAECERWISSTGDVPPERGREDIIDIFTGKRPE